MMTKGIPELPADKNKTKDVGGESSKDASLPMIKEVNNAASSLAHKINNGTTADYVASIPAPTFSTSTDLPYAKPAESGIVPASPLNKIAVTDSAPANSNSSPIKLSSDNQRNSILPAAGGPTENMFDSKPAAQMGQTDVPALISNPNAIILSTSHVENAGTLEMPSIYKSASDKNVRENVNPSDGSSLRDNANLRLGSDLSGTRPGTGALIGKVQDGPSLPNSKDAIRPGNQSDAPDHPPNGSSALLKYSGQGQNLSDFARGLKPEGQTISENSSTSGTAGRRPEVQNLDGARSGIDHTSQGIIGRGTYANQDGARSPKVPLSEGGIADLKTADGKVGDSGLNSDRMNTRLPDPKTLDGKIGDGKVSDGRTGDGKLVDGKGTAGKSADGKSDKGLDGKSVLGDKLPGTQKGDKPTGGTDGSGGPSAFLQFLENQAGLRGIGLPGKADGKDESKANAKNDGKSDNKSDNKSDKRADNKVDNKIDGKTDATANGKLEGKIDFKAEVKPNSKADSKPDFKPDTKADSGISGKSDATKGGIGIPGGKSGAFDNFIGMVKDIKDNIRNSLKNLGERSAPTLPLKEGEFAVVARSGKIPPVRENLSNAYIVVVLIPKGLVGWSIVRNPGMKPSDNPQPALKGKAEATRINSSDGKPVSGKPALNVELKPDSKPTLRPDVKSEPKPFDINNPDVKSRPFIQMHGVDSDYKDAGSKRTVSPETIKAEVVKAAPVKPVPVKSEEAKSEQAKSELVKSDAKPYIDVAGANKSVVSDQSSTRPSRAVEDPSQDKPSHSKERESRLRYVNQALDAQESTWNSEEDDEAPITGQELHAPLGRYTYIVRAGDTVESVAVVELNDATLAPLLFRKNKQHVLPEEEYGSHPLAAGVVIDLPTPAEIKAFRGF